MAVRKSEDRRVGGGPEKLLTLEEAARRLDLTPDDVEAMIQAGKLTAFRLGGNLIRLRLQDVEAIRAHQWQALPEEMPPPQPPLELLSGNVSDPSLWDRVSDFFYFNDFYIVAALIILTLLAFIFAF